jgi:CBS domain-containing protein
MARERRMDNEGQDRTADATTGAGYGREENPQTYGNFYTGATRRRDQHRPGGQSGWAGSRGQSGGQRTGRSSDEGYGGRSQGDERGRDVSGYDYDRDRSGGYFDRDREGTDFDREGAGSGAYFERRGNFGQERRGRSEGPGDYSSGNRDWGYGRESGWGYLERGDDRGGYRGRDYGYGRGESGRGDLERRRSRWQREPLTATEVMTRDPKTVTRDTPLQEVARIMKDENVGIVPVTDEQRRLLGVVTDRDIVVRTLAEGKSPMAMKAGDVMSDDVEAVTPDEELRNVIELMGRKQVRRVPVVDRDDRLLGIISLGDLATRADYDEDLQEALENISARRSFWSKLWS